jgi:glycosyltransferase involved in cell wall biosynthesis
VYAHNAESVIDRCITSAVSCRELNDLQIVVLDDGSSDETLKKLYSWKSRFSSTITIIHLENMEGYGAALQKEISASHGLYFKVVDANDWVDPKNLDNLIQEIKRWKIIPDIIDASYCLIGARDGNLTQVKKTSNQAEYGHVYSLNKSRISYLPMVGPNLFYLTEKLQQAEIEFSTEEPFAKFEYILLPLRWLDTIIFIDYSVYRLSVVDEFENGFTPIGCTQDNSNINIFLKCVLGWYGEFEQVFKNTRRLGYVNEIIAGQLLLPYYGLILRQVRNKWVALRTVEQFDDLLKENSPALYKELE